MFGKPLHPFLGYGARGGPLSVLWGVLQMHCPGGFAQRWDHSTPAIHGGSGHTYTAGS